MAHQEPKLLAFISCGRRRRRAGDKSWSRLKINNNNRMNLTPAPIYLFILFISLHSASQIRPIEAIPQNQQNFHLQTPQQPHRFVAEPRAPLRPYSQQRQAHFAEPLEALTQKVAVGRSVRFRCAVNDIGDHLVNWFHKDKRLLLAVGNKTVAWRERIQVSSQANSVFFLQIDTIQLSDKVSASVL